MPQLLPVTIALAFIAFLLSLWLFFMDRKRSYLQLERDHLHDELDEALIGKRALKEEIGRLSTEADLHKQTTSELSKRIEESYTLTATHLASLHRNLDLRASELERQITQQQIVVPTATTRGRPRKERTVDGGTGEIPAIPRTPSGTVDTTTPGMDGGGA